MNDLQKDAVSSRGECYSAFRHCALTSHTKFEDGWYHVYGVLYQGSLPTAAAVCRQVNCLSQLPGTQEEVYTTTVAGEGDGAHEQSWRGNSGSTILMLSKIHIGHRASKVGGVEFLRLLC